MLTVFPAPTEPESEAERVPGAGPWPLTVTRRAIHRWRGGPDPGHSQGGDKGNLNIIKTSTTPTKAQRGHQSLQLCRVAFVHVSP